MWKSMVLFFRESPRVSVPCSYTNGFLTDTCLVRNLTYNVSSLLRDPSGTEPNDTSCRHVASFRIFYPSRTTKDTPCQSRLQFLLYTPGLHP